MSFSSRIRQARKEKGLTQEELGAAMGIAKSTVAGYERGTSHPGEEIIIKLMSALGVDANFLWQDEMKSFQNDDQPVILAPSVGGTGVETLQGNDLAEAIALFATLPSEALDDLKIIVEALQYKYNKPKNDL
jgi:transcriptional regulator with XRE-family HTH domain